MAPVLPPESGIVWLYHQFLFLYPAEFRNEYRRELCLAFKDEWQEKHSRIGRLFVWLRAIFGILYHAPKEHWHMIVHDFRYAFRILRKDWSFTLAAIAILALGIGATTLVFSLANGLLLRPLPYPESSRIVSVQEDSPVEPNEDGHINFLNYLDIRPRVTLLEDIGLYGGGGGLIRGEGPAEQVQSTLVTDGVFSVLRVAPLLGRTFTPAENMPNGPKVVILGEGLWRRRYGSDPKILGKVLDIDDSRWTVIGVMPANFYFPDRSQLWLPLQADPRTSFRTDYFLRAIGRLKPGVSINQASAELESLLEQIHRENPAANNGWIALVAPIREHMVGTYRKGLITLLVAVGLLLLIACANVSNLLLVKASARGREIAVRTALGATRRRIVRQLLSESAILGVAGALLGILLAKLGVPALLALVPTALPQWMNFSLDQRVLGFATGIALLAICVFGMVPAWGVSKTDLTSVLKEAGRGGSSSMRQRLLRNGLVIGEVALSVILLAAAGLMIRSFAALRLQNLGFNPENILTLSVDYPQSRYPDGPASRAMVDRLRQEVSAIPGVASAAFSSGVPLDDGWGRIFTIEGRPVALKEMRAINHIVVTPGYFQTLGIPILQGRDFTAPDFDAPHVVLVGESFAKRYWPGETALGKRIRFGPPANDEPWNTVVGVVADYKHGTLRGPDRSNVYLPYQKDVTPSSLLIRTARDPMQLAQTVKSRISGFDRDIAVGPALTLDQIIDRVSWQDRFLTVLIASFAFIALALAAVGLYAIISYTVALGTHEIGIRVALGASASNVRTLILRQGLALSGTGLLIGIGAAFVLARLLRAQLYETSPLDPATYVTVPIVLILVTVLAVFLPTRRATRVDPVIALRHD
ncbi:MAG TPA: ABC transporter permease [Candidatus Acidoferrum sp.]|jgi:putative ABC transport system permease protein